VIKVLEAERAVERNRILFQGGAMTQREYEFSQTQLTDQQDMLDNLHIQLEMRERTLEVRESQLRDARTRLRNIRNRGGEDAVEILYQQQENAILLSHIELERIRADLERLTETTKSPITGHIVELNVREGQTAARGSMVVKLEDRSGLLIKADISEFDAPRMGMGYTALVNALGLPGVVFEAKINKIAAAALE
jgi:multidrug resistance efflux pump